MGINIFISYSHKDEQLKDSLQEHLSGLKRAGLVSDWEDRKILPGEKWENEISENLESSDLILFLISSSFLDSDYCINVEAKRAIEMHKNHQAELIPIVVRPVKWNDSEFSELQALPKDAKAVTSWENEDEAWVNVVNGLQDRINNLPKEKRETKISLPNNKLTLSQNNKEWLEETAIKLTHNKVDQIKLSDIYIIPDLKFETDNRAKKINIKSASSIFPPQKKYIISGEEQQGKTSFLKYLYTELLKISWVPLYLDARNIKKSDLEPNLSNALHEQYEELDINNYLDYDKKIILIDNIDEIGLRPKFRDLFLERINNIFEISILTCHESFLYISNDIPTLDEFTKVDLLGFGNKNREDIIQRWISLGSEETINERDLFYRCDETKEQLNNIIKKNIVPPKPIYILMLLQMFEANSKLNLELTSLGHCYQQLIYQSLDNAKIAKTDFDKYLNVLTELSWWTFINETPPNQAQLNLFFKEYCKTYISVDKDEVIEKLIANSILCERGYTTCFKFSYIYYFFVGKKIAENYTNSEETKEKVSILLSKLHREDFANILIFITHHTKDSWVLNSIQNTLSSLFKDQSAATLEKIQLSFMNDFMKSIPKLVMEQRNEIQKERDAHNERLDELERNQPNENHEEPNDILANINKTFKGMEIAGQIIRNRHATLPKNSLTNLAKHGIESGLRFLEYFIFISGTTKNEIIKLIANHLEEHPDLPDKVIEKYAETAYLQMTYGVINAVIRKISSSVGSKEALEIYSILEKRSGTPAASLIKQAIELQSTKTLKIQSVSDCADKLHDNPVCTQILKELIIQHIRMFPVEYRKKQQLSDLLDISIKGQNLIDQQRKRLS